MVFVVQTCVNAKYTFINVYGRCLLGTIRRFNSNLLK